MMQRNLRELFNFNFNLKFDFIFSRLLKDVRKCSYADYAIMGFRGIRDESIYEIIEKERAKAFARGEPFDIKQVKIIEGKIIFNPIKKKNEERKVKRRRSADLLRKFDYRKLDFEIKQMKKNG